VHHAPCLHFLASHNLSCPVVHSVLGPSASLERPPTIVDGVALALAVSEEVRGALAATALGRAAEVRLFRNWFDDRGLHRTRTGPAGSIRRVVVVTNHLDPQLRRGLEVIAARNGGFTWTHWGAPGPERSVTAETLAPFDAVISIGRTALLAGAIGKRCLLYDVHGCDGWLTAERMAAVAERNFSGRAAAARLEPDALEELLLGAGARVDAGAAADACWAGYRLTARVGELRVHHADAAAKGPGLGPAARVAHETLGALFADTRHALEGQLQARIDTLVREVTQVTQRFERLRLERDALDARLATVSEELDLLRRSTVVQLADHLKQVPGLREVWLRSRRFFGR
jgi:hypothetical protein